MVAVASVAHHPLHCYVGPASGLTPRIATTELFVRELQRRRELGAEVDWLAVATHLNKALRLVLSSPCMSP